MRHGDELDRDLADALRVLDYPVPPVSADSVIQRARARAHKRRWRFAAAAVVMLAASAAAALPGSPVRRWIVNALSDATPVAPTRGTPQRPPADTPPTQPDAGGVVTTIGSSADVVFAASKDSGTLVIRLIPEPELRIRSVDGVGYHVRPTGLLINNSGSRANYELDVSERASDLRVSVGGRTVFDRRGGRVVTGPPQRADGAHVVSLRVAR